MADGVLRLSYRERLENLGALIDSEIAEAVEREVQKFSENYLPNPAHIPATADENRRCPTASEIEECLLLFQSRSDAANIKLHLEAKPYLCSEYAVVASAPRDIREWILSFISEQDLKRIFPICCENGNSDLMKSVLHAWSIRLINGTDEGSNLVLAIRSGSISGTQELLTHGADISVISASGNNIVQEAVSSDSADLVEVVLNHIPHENLLSFLTFKNPANLSSIDLAAGSSDQVHRVVRSHFLIGLSLDGNGFYKEGSFENAVERYREAITVCESIPSDQKTENLVKLEYNLARSLFRLQRFSECVSHCSRCIELDRTYLNALSQRAQAHVSLCNFEMARKDYESIIAVMGSDSSSPATVRQQNEFRLKLLEVESVLKTDHYSTLGVEKFVDEQQVKSAYRQLAKKHHPDKVMNESDDFRIRSRNVFTRIQEAYETLTSAKDEYDMNLRIQMSTDAVRQNLLRRRYSMESSPPASPTGVIRQMRMRQFLGSPPADDKYRASPTLSRSFDVLFRN